MDQRQNDRLYSEDSLSPCRTSASVRRPSYGRKSQQMNQGDRQPQSDRQIQNDRQLQSDRQLHSDKQHQSEEQLQSDRQHQSDRQNQNDRQHQNDRQNLSERQLQSIKQECGDGKHQSEQRNSDRQNINDRQHHNERQQQNNKQQHSDRQSPIDRQTQSDRQTQNERQAKETDHDGQGPAADRGPESNISEKNSEFSSLKVQGSRHRRLSGRHGGQDDKEKETEDQKSDRWMRGSAGDQPHSHSSCQGSGMSPSKTTTESSSPPPTSSSSMGRPGPMHPATARTSASNPALAEPEPDSDSDMVHPDQQNRTRQKKFIKNFKGLPIEETVHKRYSCALVGDILLQGHLYVTENYLGFHSNVFGYVTRIQIPLISVTSITKEKTAKFIPNAVAVSTVEDTHTFTSLISRDATFKAMTKSWKKAIARNNLANMNDITAVIGGVDDIDDEDEIDGDDQLEYESTDSMTSANHIDSYALPLKKDTESKHPFLVKRASTNGGAVFYQARTSLTHQTSKETPVQTPSAVPQSILHQMLVAPTSTINQLAVALISLPPSSLMLISLISLLVLLFFSSIYLVIRLEYIQHRVDSALVKEPSSPFEQLAGWQSLLHTHSSRKIQEYLDTNLEQIAKVRESLEKLSMFLNAHTENTEEEQH